MTQKNLINMLSLPFYLHGIWMENPQSLSSIVIFSRLKLIGTRKFTELGLSKEELQMFLTVDKRQDWTDNMQKNIPELGVLNADEEEE